MHCRWVVARPLARTVGCPHRRRRFSSTFQFENDTAVRTTGASGIYQSVNPLSDQWSIGDAPNGGMLIAMGINAMRDALVETTHRDPLTLTAHFLGKSKPGENVDIPVEVIKRGRSYSTVRASLNQSGVQRISLLATFGDLDSQSGPSFVKARDPLDLPPLSECPVNLCERANSFGTLPQRIALHVPQNAPFLKKFARGKSGGEPLLEGYGSLVDGCPTSLRAVALFTDCFPPALLNSVETRWVPTIELTVHFYSRPATADGVVQVRFFNEYLQNGLSSTNGEVFDRSGKLLALSRQLCTVIG